MPVPAHLQLSVKPLPEPLPIKKLLGPSFILLGLGLGSGEVILWPYLASNYGLGIVWGMLVGITFQFFINMEVERYALINGESVFVGFVRMFKWLPVWFIVSTFIGFGWPGIGLSGATLLANALGGGQPIMNPRILAVLMFLFIGAVLTLGKVLYQTVERLQKVLISIGVPFILFLTLYLSERMDFQALAQGLIGIGNDYHWLPAGIALTSFFGALGYSGAGGNLNLAQSFYIRDKGYGMGAYADKIKSLFTSSGANQSIRLSGTTFKVNPTNMERFTVWWKRINIEHLVVFWGLGLLTMLMLALLSYTTVYGLDNSQGINFVINEAMVIGKSTLPFFGVLFLLVTGVMLLATQLTVLDSTSRIITENILLLRSNSSVHISKMYYSVLWIQLLFGIVVMFTGFAEPRTLITLGAVFNAVAMFVLIGLMLFLNKTQLPTELRPSFFRTFVLVVAFVFFGTFSFLTLRGIFQ
ncbi:Nramp family divalent metal transporter [candidate division WWE3 bacterium]|nr:Nramp family divalent metal transporter [candidate division WWE3 bacterium]